MREYKEYADSINRNPLNIGLNFDRLFYLVGVEITATDLQESLQSLFNDICLILTNENVIDCITPSRTRNTELFYLHEVIKALKYMDVVPNKKK